MKSNHDSNKERDRPPPKSVKGAAVYAAWNKVRELVWSTNPDELKELFLRIPKREGALFAVMCIKGDQPNAADIFYLQEISQADLPLFLKSKTPGTPLVKSSAGREERIQRIREATR
jgi:hypothetical protein